MASRGFYKAVVRRIPAFLSKNEFYLGLNVALPVNQWYFCQGGSQAPSAVALTAWTHSLSQATSTSGGHQGGIGSQSSTTGLSLGTLPTRSYAMLGAASQEYSVAYFGFDSAQIMDQFIAKYHNFVVEVDQKRKYSLEVTRAWFQPMPTLNENDSTAQAASDSEHTSQASKLISKAGLKGPLEELDDFKLFLKSLDVKKPALLPLEVQIQLEKEKQAAQEAAAHADLIDMKKVQFRAAEDGESDDTLDLIDKHQKDLERRNNAPDTSHNYHKSDKKTLKMSHKVAPLVAALNEQSALLNAAKGHLSEQEQLLRKNKKKANQMKRKQQQKQKKRDDKQAKQMGHKGTASSDLGTPDDTNEGAFDHGRRQDATYQHQSSYGGPFDKKYDDRAQYGAGYGPKQEGDRFQRGQKNRLQDDPYQRKGLQQQKQYRDQPHDERTQWQRNEGSGTHQNYDQGRYAAGGQQNYDRRRYMKQQSADGFQDQQEDNRNMHQYGDQEQRAFDQQYYGQDRQRKQPQYYDQQNQQMHNGYNRGGYQNRQYSNQWDGQEDFRQPQQWDNQQYESSQFTSDFAPDFNNVQSAPAFVPRSQNNQQYQQEFESPSQVNHDSAQNNPFQVSQVSEVTTFKPQDSGNAEHHQTNPFATTSPSQAWQEPKNNMQQAKMSNPFSQSSGANTATHAYPGSSTNSQDFTTHQWTSPPQTNQFIPSAGESTNEAAPQMGYAFNSDDAPMGTPNTGSASFQTGRSYPQ